MKYAIHGKYHHGTFLLSGTSKHQNLRINLQKKLPGLRPWTLLGDFRPPDSLTREWRLAQIARFTLRSWGVYARLIPEHHITQCLSSSSSSSSFCSLSQVWRKQMKRDWQRSRCVATEGCFVSHGRTSRPTNPSEDNSVAKTPWWTESGVAS